MDTRYLLNYKNAHELFTVHLLQQDVKNHSYLFNELQDEDCVSSAKLHYWRL